MRFLILLIGLSVAAAAQDKPKEADPITDKAKLAYVSAQRDVIAIRGEIGKELLQRLSTAITALQAAYGEIEVTCKKSNRTFDETSLTCVPIPPPVAPAAKPESVPKK